MGKKLKVGSTEAVRVLHKREEENRKAIENWTERLKDARGAMNGSLVLQYSSAEYTGETEAELEDFVNTLQSMLTEAEESLDEHRDAANLRDMAVSRLRKLALEEHMIRVELKEAGTKPKHDEPLTSVRVSVTGVDDQL